MLILVATTLTVLFHARTASAQATVFKVSEGADSDVNLGVLSVGQSQHEGRHRFYATAQYPNALIQYTRLVVGPHGWPQSYLLQAGIQGQSIRIRVQRKDGVLLEKVSQGSAIKRYRFPLAKPVDFVDNNDLSGLQALLNRLAGKAIRGNRFRVFVPQAIGFGTLLVEKTGNAKITIGHSRQTVRFLQLRLQVNNQRVPIRVTLNPATNQLLQFSQLKTSVQITAQPRPRLGHAVTYRRCAVMTTISSTLVQHKSRSELMLPRMTQKPWPALLLIRSTRDLDPAERWPWRAPMNNIDQELANGLACRGVATLLLSRTPPHSATGRRSILQARARKIARGLATLANQPEVDPRRIFLAGNSIGGLLALYTLSGLHPRISGLILIDTPGKPLRKVLTQSIVESARREGAPDNRLAALRESLTQYFRGAVQNGGNLRLSGRSPAQPYPHLTNILLGILMLHPAALAARVHVPMLIVQGGKDLSVMPNNAILLAKAAPNAQRLTVANMTHSLVISRLPPLSALLTQPDQRVDERLISAIARWIKGNGKEKLKTASSRATY